MEPTLTFLYNTTSGIDVVYTGTGESDANFSVINIGSDKLVFTGGGIDDSVLTYTCASGTRSSTIRPSVSSYVIPYTYIETATEMTQIPLAGSDTNRYVFCVYVSGTCNSDIFLESWDDTTFSTYNLPVLQGSTNSGDESYINAIRTLAAAPPSSWNGDSSGAAYLRGSATNERVPLRNASTITDEAVYFNIYVRLQTDTSTFHNQCVLAWRYLYS